MQFKQSKRSQISKRRKLGWESTAHGPTPALWQAVTASSEGPPGAPWIESDRACELSSVQLDPQPVSRRRDAIESWLEFLPSQLLLLFIFPAFSKLDDDADDDRAFSLLKPLNFPLLYAPSPPISPIRIFYNGMRTLPRNI